jgi:hypothetical protein
MATVIDPNWPRTVHVEEAAQSLVDACFEYAVVPLLSDDTNTERFRKRVEHVPSGPSNIVALCPAGVFAVCVKPGMWETLHETPAYAALKSFGTLSYEYGAAANFVFKHDHGRTAAAGEIYQGPLAKAFFQKSFLAFGLFRNDGKAVMVTKTSDPILTVDDSDALLELLTSTGLLSEQYW